jgi:hypothetical protein
MPVLIGIDWHGLMLCYVTVCDPEYLCKREISQEATPSSYDASTIFLRISIWIP